MPCNREIRRGECGAEDGGVSRLMSVLINKYEDRERCEHNSRHALRSALKRTDTRVPAWGSEK